MTPGVIRSAERMTYTNVNKAIEGDEGCHSAVRGAGRTFSRYERACALLNKRRNEDRFDRF